MSAQQSLKINHFGLASYPPGSSFGPRTLHDYEFVWIEQGDCVWDVDGQQIGCPAGTVILCKPGMRDQFFWDKSHTTKHGYIHFETDEVFDGLLELNAHTIKCSGQDVLIPLLRHVVWLAGEADDKAALLGLQSLKHALNCFLSGYISQCSHGESNSLFHPAMERAFKALREMWKGCRKFKPPAIEDWASAAAISRSHFIRICVQELGVTPQQLLRQIRLDHSLSLLRRTNLSVSAVSEICGFANPYHYSRCCREVYGLSPRELRSRIVNGGSAPAGSVPGLNRIMMQIIEV